MGNKIDLIYKNKSVIGLDIGSSSIKAVQLKKQNNLVRLIGYGSIETPKDVVTEGVITDPKKLSEIIKKLISDPKMGKFTAVRAASSLPETKIFTRIINLPDLSKRELDEAVMWEVDQYIPTPVNELYVDWQIVGELETKKEKNIEVMIVAAPRKIVDSYLETFNILGLELFSLEMGLGSVSRAMVSNKEKDEKIVIVDIGGDSTSIAIYDQTLRVTGSIPIGGSAFLNSLAGKDSNTESLIQKCEKGDQKSCKIVNEAVDETLGSIPDEVTKLIKYYSDLKDKEKNNVSRALICGGGASIPGLASALEKKIGIPVEVGNPWSNISIYPLKPIPKKEASRYTNAVGLALKGIVNDK